MNITVKDKIGFIRRSKDLEGKESFKFIESKIKKIVTGKTKTSIYSDKFYAIDADEIESNTDILKKGNGIMLVGEPFITTPEYSEHCLKVVDYWNEHGAKSILE
jgi:hypothetical protein